jgi:hypothetical protein
MAENPSIELPCQFRPGDALVITDEVDNQSVDFRVQVNIAELKHDPPYVQLSLDDARALFNWLGVRLHK